MAEESSVTQAPGPWTADHGRVPGIKAWPAYLTWTTLGTVPAPESLPCHLLRVPEPRGGTALQPGSLTSPTVGAKSTQASGDALPASWRLLP